MRKLKEILELIVFKHSIFALPFLLTAMLAALRTSELEPGEIARKFVLAIIAAVAARSFAMGLNRLADAKIDALNARTAGRASADGRISSVPLAIFVAGCALAFILAAALISPLCAALSLPTLALLGSYSFFKRFSEFAHVVLGVCLGFACVAGEIVITGAVSAMSVALGIGVAFWTAGFDVLYALQDEEFDRAQGLFSIPARYGTAAAVFISRLFFLFAALCFLLFGLITGLGTWGFTGIFLVWAMLVFEQFLAARGRIEAAFFNTNAAISLVFLLFFVIDWIANV